MVTPDSLKMIQCRINEVRTVVRQEGFSTGLAPDYSLFASFGLRARFVSREFPMLTGMAPYG